MWIIRIIKNIIMKNIKVKSKNGFLQIKFVESSSSYYCSIYHWFINSINDFKKKQILLNKYFFLHIDIHILFTYEIF